MGILSPLGTEAEQPSRAFIDVTNFSVGLFPSALSPTSFLVGMLCSFSHLPAPADPGLEPSTLQGDFCPFALLIADLTGLMG